MKPYIKYYLLFLLSIILFMLVPFLIDIEFRESCVSVNNSQLIINGAFSSLLLPYFALIFFIMGISFCGLCVYKEKQ